VDNGATPQIGSAPEADSSFAVSAPQISLAKGTLSPVSRFSRWRSNRAKHKACWGSKASGQDPSALTSDSIYLRNLARPRYVNRIDVVSGAIAIEYGDPNNSQIEG
jgi:hypothetical protein